MRFALTKDAKLIDLLIFGPYEAQLHAGNAPSSSTPLVAWVSIRIIDALELEIIVAAHLEVLLRFLPGVFRNGEDEICIGRGLVSDGPIGGVVDMVDGELAVRHAVLHTLETVLGSDCTLDDVLAAMSFPKSLEIHDSVFDIRLTKLLPILEVHLPAVLVEHAGQRRLVLELAQAQKNGL